MKAFSSKPTAVGKAIDFELDGKTYEFIPPKASTQLVSLMAIKGHGSEADIQRAAAMFSWLGTGLNKQHEPRRGYTGHVDFDDACQACTIQKRLEDPEDTLEADELMEIITWLMGESSGRPTT